MQSPYSLREASAEVYAVQIRYHRFHFPVTLDAQDAMYAVVVIETRVARLSRLPRQLDHHRGHRREHHQGSHRPYRQAYLQEAFHQAFDHHHRHRRTSS